ncbi:MAG: ATP-binding cassette domain-containing protein [Lagierella massiliensis]|nr:ATP-binding cassette domain-containing protein [Lagierella massiliensis]
MIEITNLSKSYKTVDGSKKSVLNELNFKISKGDKILLVGDNATGKTTLLKIIGLLDGNFQGQYKIFDKDVHTLSSDYISKLRNETFGFIFQDYNLLEDETVYENILIPLLYSKKYSRNKRKLRIKEMLENFDMEDVIYNKAKELSGGQRQKVVSSRALINDPEFLIMDEPTSSLNHKSKLEFIDFIEDVLNEKTIIHVTHDQFIIDLLSRRGYKILELNNGKLIDRKGTIITI